jgi:AcrR family transcriptional regulator
MPVSTKERMIAGAADLISRRGVHATTLRDVVQHTGTPRGSLAHHFPGGKQQMLEEVIHYAAESVASPLAALMQEQGAQAGLRSFIGWWRHVLQQSGFEAGCPVLAVAVEPIDEAEAGASSSRLRDLAHEAFDRWQSLLSAAFVREGVPAGRARRLATLVVAAIEGTVAMCRAERSTRALDEVQRELEAVIATALAAP